MTLIRLDIDELRREAREMGEAAGEMHRLASEALEATAAAPTIEGQFGPEVRAMGQELNAMYEGEAASLEERAQDLVAIAARFEVVEQELELRLGLITADMSGLLEELEARRRGRVPGHAMPAARGGDGDDEEDMWWVGPVVGAAWELIAGFPALMSKTVFPPPGVVFRGRSGPSFSLNSRVEGDPTDPNPPTSILVALGIPLTLAIMGVELGLVVAEIWLAQAMPLSAGAGPLAPIFGGAIVTSEVVLMGAGILLIDIDVAYWSYTYRVTQAGGSFPVQFELLPPWGLGR